MTVQDMFTTIGLEYFQDNSCDGVLSTANGIDISDIAELDLHDAQEEEEESDGEILVDLDGNDIVKIPRLPIPHHDQDDQVIISYIREAYIRSPLVATRRCASVYVIPSNILEYTALPTTTFQAHDEKGNIFKSHFRRIHWDVYCNFFQRIRWSTYISGRR